MNITHAHTHTDTHSLNTSHLQTEHNDLRAEELLTLLPFVCMVAQATELAELTSKISQLEEAKKKKDEEAKRWQKRVRENTKKINKKT